MRSGLDSFCKGLDFISVPRSRRPSNREAKICKLQIAMQQQNCLTITLRDPRTLKDPLRANLIAFTSNAFTPKTLVGSEATVTVPNRSKLVANLCNT